MVPMIVTIVLVALLTPLAVLLVRFNRKRHHIIQCARAATEVQLETIYSCMDGAVGVTSSAVLGRTNRHASGDNWLIPIPGYVKPWGGQVISGKQGEEVTFVLVESAALEPRLKGCVYRTVARPPITEDDEQNVATLLVRFVGEHPTLKTALSAVCPEYPAQLLQYLLGPGVESYELDPINEIQLGGSPAWVQDEEFPICRQCQKQLTLILQVPGTLLPGTAVPRGTFFFFGCSEHTDETKTIAQYT
jgi:hypothetical protein